MVVVSELPVVPEGVGEVEREEDLGDKVVLLTAVVKVVEEVNGSSKKGSNARGCIVQELRE